MEKQDFIDFLTWHKNLSEENAHRPAKEIVDKYWKYLEKKLKKELISSGIKN